MKNRLLAMLEVAFIALFIFSGYKLFTIWQDYNTGDDIYEESQDSFIEIADGKEGDFNLNIDELKKINADALGWIYIQDTPVNYPILQTNNNDYYLKHTYNHKYSDFGSIFYDFRSNSDMSDQNTLIYGHNTKNGSMFGTLKKYKNESYLKQHPFVYLILDGKTLKYQIISAFTVETSDDVYTLSFSRTSEFKDWIKRTIGKSEVPVDKYEPSGDDHIITLSTCTSRSKTERFVVIGALVETKTNNGSAVVK